MDIIVILAHPHVGMGLGRPTQTLWAWDLVIQTHPHVGMGLGRATQTLQEGHGLCANPLPAPCGDGFGSSDPNLEEQDGLVSTSSHLPSCGDGFGSTDPNLEGKTPCPPYQWDGFGSSDPNL